MMVMILIMKIIFLVLDSYVKLLMIMILLHFNNHKIKKYSSYKRYLKKVCSQVYLGECNFINDSYNKNG